MKKCQSSYQLYSHTVHPSLHLFSNERIQGWFRTSVYDLFYPPPPPPLPPAGPFIFQFQYSPHGDRFYFSCDAAALPTGSFLFPLPWFHLTSSSSKSSSSPSLPSVSSVEVIHLTFN
eukprot:426275_1